ncbi:hypothetical protein ACROYT_G019362 [Oculina patagonica]
MNDSQGRSAATLPRAQCCRVLLKRTNMASERLVFKEVLPKQGLLFTEQTPMPVLCKPKIMPMKSVTLEKLETMQKEAQEAVKRQEQEQKLQGVFT